MQSVELVRPTIPRPFRLEFSDDSLIDLQVTPNDCRPRAAKRNRKELKRWTVRLGESWTAATSCSQTDGGHL